MGLLSTITHDRECMITSVTFAKMDSENSESRACACHERNFREPIHGLDMPYAYFTRLGFSKVTRYTTINVKDEQVARWSTKTIIYGDRSFTMATWNKKCVFTWPNRSMNQECVRVSRCYWSLLIYSESASNDVNVNRIFAIQSRLRAISRTKRCHDAKLSCKKNIVRGQLDSGGIRNETYSDGICPIQITRQPLIVSFIISASEWAINDCLMSFIFAINCETFWNFPIQVGGIQVDATHFHSSIAALWFCLHQSKRDSDEKWKLIQWNVFSPHPNLLSRLLCGALWGRVCRRRRRCNELKPVSVRIYEIWINK